MSWEPLFHTFCGEFQSSQVGTYIPFWLLQLSWKQKSLWWFVHLSCGHLLGDSLPGPPHSGLAALQTVQIFLSQDLCVGPLLCLDGSFLLYFLSQPRGFSDYLLCVKWSTLFFYFPSHFCFPLQLLLLACRQEFLSDSLKPAQGQARYRCSINIY